MYMYLVITVQGHRKQAGSHGLHVIWPVILLSFTTNIFRVLTNLPFHLTYLLACLALRQFRVVIAIDASRINSDPWSQL